MFILLSLDFLLSHFLSVIQRMALCLAQLSLLYIIYQAAYTQGLQSTTKYNLVPKHMSLFTLVI